MRLTYDPEVDILMVRLAEDASRRANGQDLPFGAAYADLAADGTVLAFEIRDASKRYPLEELMAHEVAYKPMTLAEAAKLSGISPQALKKACSQGRLKASKIGRDWTVTLDDLQEYAENRIHDGNKQPAMSQEAR